MAEDATALVSAATAICCTYLMHHAGVLCKLTAYTFSVCPDWLRRVLHWSVLELLPTACVLHMYTCFVHSMAEGALFGAAVAISRTYVVHAIHTLYILHN